MLENQTKKILLLSNDPIDVSFLSEITVTQQADLELVDSAPDLCSKIAKYRADNSLAAIFVDVSNATLLRKFEFEFQSKLGNSIASEMSKMVHFISGTQLALNREVMQSPYFSFYSERVSSGFAFAAKHYQLSFYRASEYLSKPALSFDLATRIQAFENIKKGFLTKEMSSEWIIKFKRIWEEMVDQAFPARFELSVSSLNDVFVLTIHSSNFLDKEKVHSDKFLEFGVSQLVSEKGLILFVPVFKEYSKVLDAFKFLKVEK